MKTPDERDRDFWRRCKQIMKDLQRHNQRHSEPSSNRTATAPTVSIQLKRKGTK